jgi:hypothetical protein
MISFMKDFHIEFYWKDFHLVWYWGSSAKICWSIAVSFKITQLQWALYMKIYMCYCTAHMSNSRNVYGVENILNKLHKKMKHVFPQYTSSHWSHSSWDNETKESQCIRIVIVCVHFLIWIVSIFWDITPCGPLKVIQCFRGTYRLHLQGREISNIPGWKHVASRAGFLLGLFFDPEDGRDMFPRNVGWHSTDHTALYPRR